MTMTKVFLAAALAGFTVIATVAAQGTPPPQTPPAPVRRKRRNRQGRGGRGRGQGRGEMATFPAQQRPPGDPELIAEASRSSSRTAAPATARIFAAASRAGRICFVRRSC